MATYDEICGATQRAWKMFESTLMMVMEKSRMYFGTLLIRKITL